MYTPESTYSSYSMNINNQVSLPVFILALIVLSVAFHFYGWCSRTVVITIVIFALMISFSQNISGFTAEQMDMSGFKRSEDSILGNNAVSGPRGGKSGKMDDPPIINTGPYDGLCLKTGNDEYWKKSPYEVPLIPNDNLYTYLASQGPIKMKISDQSALIGPPIDGVDGSDEKMFILANNVSSPLCCPSTFTTSTGCLCTTKNQRDFIAARGILEQNPSDDNPVDEIEV